MFGRRLRRSYPSSPPPKTHTNTIEAVANGFMISFTVSMPAFALAPRHLTGIVSTGARAPPSVSVSVNKNRTVESVLLERQSVLSIQNQ